MVETKYGLEAGIMHNGTLEVFMTSYLLTKVTDYQADYCSAKYSKAEVIMPLK